MTNRYEYARADGSPDWTDGTGFGTAWADVEDELRFHKPGGFKITNRATGKTGGVRQLNELEARVHQRLDDSPEMSVIEIRAESDGFKIIMRRDHVPPGKGQQLADLMLTKLGMPYLRDAIVSSGRTDCSGLTMWGWNRMGVDGIPHNAHDQHLLFGQRAGFIEISRSQLVIGDPVWCDNDAHIATYYGIHDGHPSVVDTEPHDAGAPSGWGSTMLGVGVRIRPMDGNYYCADTNGFGRIVEINGRP